MESKQANNYDVLTKGLVTYCTPVVLPIFVEHLKSRFPALSETLEDKEVGQLVYQLIAPIDIDRKRNHLLYGRFQDYSLYLRHTGRASIKRASLCDRALKAGLDCIIHYFQIRKKTATKQLEKLNMTTQTFIDCMFEEMKDKKLFSITSSKNNISKEDFKKGLSKLPSRVDSSEKEVGYHGDDDLTTMGAIRSKMVQNLRHSYPSRKETIGNLEILEKEIETILPPEGQLLEDFKLDLWQEFNLASLGLGLFLPRNVSIPIHKRNVCFACHLIYARTNDRRRSRYCPRCRNLSIAQRNKQRVRICSYPGCNKVAKRVWCEIHGQGYRRMQNSRKQ